MSMKIKKWFQLSKFLFFVSIIHLVFTFILTLFFGSTHPLSSIFFNLSISFISISSVLFAYFGQQREIHHSKIQKQIGLIEGLIAELDVLDGDNQEIFGGTPLIGNLNWYQQQICADTWFTLDHKVNSVSIDSIIAGWDSSLYSKANFGKIIRTLSNINDKLSQLNYYIFEMRNQWININKKGEITINSQFPKSSCLGLVLEVFSKARELRKELNKINQYLESIKISGYLFK